jgi:nucleotide-binding universal stress UspA family protein
MCTHTTDERPNAELGRVAEAVLLGAPCPVVMVRPDRARRPWPLNTVLLPHDGTPTTSGAISPAADLARRADAELLVLHVAAQGVGRPTEPGTLTAPRYVDQSQHEWSDWSQEFLARLTALGQCPQALRLRVVLGAGEPGAEIVHALERRECSLVVMGWHGQLEGEHGSTLKAVIGMARCPVLVVRVDQPHTG